jgi:hypothetical protein
VYLGVSSPECRSKPGHRNRKQVIERWITDEILGIKNQNLNRRRLRGN